VRCGRLAESPVVLGRRCRELPAEALGNPVRDAPTDARITLVVAAAAPLKVCQLGTTFSTHWKGGCRRLAERPLALPTSGGAVHIGFRILPSNGRATRVMALRVRWHCVDHYFALMRGKTEIRTTSPVFDC
jgi:hypothetical protein